MAKVYTGFVLLLAIAVAAVFVYREFYLLEVKLSAATQEATRLQGQLLLKTHNETTLNAALASAQEALAEKERLREISEGVIRDLDAKVLKSNERELSMRNTIATLLADKESAHYACLRSPTPAPVVDVWNHGL
jgi:hypothetical protein